MRSTSLRNIAAAVVRRAQRQGFVVAADIQEELTRAGLSEGDWKDVLALARPSLRSRQGRYYYKAPLSDRQRQEQQQQRLIDRAVRELVRHHRTEANQLERRELARSDFIQPVKVQTEDQREFALLSRDLSTSGIRLIGTRSLLGQKVRVLIPRPGGAKPWTFLVRILWTCAVGDDLFENGGAFLGMVTN